MPGTSSKYISRKPSNGSLKSVVVDSLLASPQPKVPMCPYTVLWRKHGGAIMAPAFGLSSFAAVASPLPPDAF